MCIKGYDGEQPAAIEAGQSSKTIGENMIFKKRLQACLPFFDILNQVKIC